MLKKINTPVTNIFLCTHIVVVAFIYEHRGLHLSLKKIEISNTNFITQHKCHFVSVPHELKPKNTVILVRNIFLETN